MAVHEVFGDRLAGWSAAMVQAAVTGRLAGLAAWHPDGTISAHPLVRDTFRRLVLDAAGAAAETSLEGMPAGKLTSRADAARVVEAIELLLDAGQWQPANDMYLNRSDGGDVWLSLPAARLGQRAASAFVATPARRAACVTQLSPRDLGFYLNSVGLWAMSSGDLAAAREYMSLGTCHDRDAGDMFNLAIGLDNLVECLGQLGQAGPARDAAAESLTSAQAADDREQICHAHVDLGWVAGLAGDAAEAERQFIAADQIRVANHPHGDHLSSVWGTQWAEWLARTGREGPARALTERNAEICRRNGWNADLARCDRILARLALAAGDTAAAGAHLAAAAAVFRDGDLLTELATTLADLAEHARASGDLDTADRYATEAITIAAARGLVPAQSAALAARVCIRAARATSAADPDLLYQGRDAADAALRLAIRHQLAWHELDALRVHALLDQAEHTDHGWAAKARTLHARLVPPGLDPDPLATVERLVAAQKAADDSQEGSAS